MKTRINPPTYFITMLFGIVVLYLVLKFYTVQILYIIPVYWNWVGVLLILIGVWLNLWADYLFKRINKTVKPYDNPSSFIKKGPFHVSRHPMYLGMLLILVGSSVFFRSLFTFIFPIAFFVIIQCKFIPMEEKKMLSLFPSEYQQYKNNVRKWL